MLSNGIYVLHFCKNAKESFFGSLHETELCVNKAFWVVFNPLVSNKVVSNEKIQKQFLWTLAKLFANLE